MPAPIRWSAADFELANVESPEGEPWLSATPDGRFRLTFFESFLRGNPAYTDIESRLYSAAGVQLFGTTAPTFSGNTTDHQPASTFMPDGRHVVVWTEEPNIRDTGDLEDVYAAVYTGSLVSLPRFLVAGGAGRQHDPVVATNGNGFVVALADDSVANGRLILKFYNTVGGLVATVTAPDAPEGVLTNDFPDYSRDVAITALANGNYVVTWTDPGRDIWARVFSGNGVAQSGLIDVGSEGPDADFPGVTALADGRFLITYEHERLFTVRGRIFEANGTPATDHFTITVHALNAQEQHLQSAALKDGRFVTVWLSTAFSIMGQVMFADGTPDGAAFTINQDGTDDKRRPTVATLADGRFVVSWESGFFNAQTIFSAIFDPREAGLEGSASGFGDDWRGTAVGDIVFMGTGDDRIDGASGNDTLYGEAGNDLLNGDGGADRLTGGANDDTLNGGGAGDTLTGGLGNDELNGGSGNDSIIGGQGHDVLAGDIGADTVVGGAGDDSISGGAGFDQLGGGAGNDRLDGGDFRDTLNGQAGNDTLIGGQGGDRLTGESGADVFLFGLVAHIGQTAGSRDVITDFLPGVDIIDLAAIDANTLIADDQAFTFIEGLAFTGVAGQLRYDALQGLLQGDVNGDGAADFSLELSGLPALQADDLVL